MQYFILSLGCAKNLVDTERFLAIMQSYGMQEALVLNESSIILVNSCAFLQSAMEELDQLLNSFFEYNDIGKAKVVVTGCITTRALKEFQELFPEVDAWIPLKNFTAFKKYLISHVLPKNAKQKALPESKRVKLEDDQHVYLRISDGCENHCSYCMIPSIRGKLVSVPIENLVAEAMAMAAESEELVIIAQDTCMYGMDLYGEKALPKLLEALCELDLYDWIRVMYLHPDHFELEWLQLWKKYPKLLPYFEIPIQHVSKRVIQSMNRQKSYDELKALFQDISQEIPEAVFRTTIMVAYPNETEADLKLLDQFLEEIDILHVGVFAYSPEKECPGYDDTDYEDPRKDYAKNLELKYAKKFAHIKEEKMQRYVGTVQQALVEHYDRDTDSFLGRLWFQAPEIDGLLYIENRPLASNPFVNVEVTDALADELCGLILYDPPQARKLR